MALTDVYINFPYPGRGLGLVLRALWAEILMIKALRRDHRRSIKYKEVGWGSEHKHWVVCVYFGNAGLQTAAEELTPIFHQGRSFHKRALRFFELSHIGDFIKGMPEDPEMVYSWRKQWGREVISGYSLTGEKCAVREPSQPGSKVVCTGFLYFASSCESTSVYLICLFLTYVSRSPAVTPHRTTRTMSMSPQCSTHGSD